MQTGFSDLIIFRIQYQKGGKLWLRKLHLKKWLQRHRKFCVTIVTVKQVKVVPEVHYRREKKIRQIVINLNIQIYGLYFNI